MNTHLKKSAAFDTLFFLVGQSVSVSVSYMPHQNGLNHTCLATLSSSSLNCSLLSRPLLPLVCPMDLSWGPFISLSTFFLCDTSIINLIFIFHCYAHDIKLYLSNKPDSIPPDPPLASVQLKVNPDYFLNFLNLTVINQSFFWQALNLHYPN